MATILSICIPTWNRSKYLRECLEHAINSVKGYENCVEIIVSNNNSDDNTEHVVNEFKVSNNFISYNRNTKNTGIDNFYIAASLARGEYIWIFGDDDKMQKQAVPTVLDKVAKGYELIIVNYSRWSNDFSKLLQGNGLKFKNDRLFKIKDNILSRVGINLGFISSVVIKKSCFFHLSESEYRPHFEYGFPHLFSNYAGLTKNGGAYLISDQLVLNRGGNSREEAEDAPKIFFEGPARIYELLSTKGYSPKSIRNAKHLILVHYVFLYILSKKRAGKIPKTLSDILFRHYASNWFFWVACFPAMLVPSLILKPIYQLSKLAKKKIGNK